MPTSEGYIHGPGSRCPLFRGVCDQGVLIGICPNRESCQRISEAESSSSYLLNRWR